MGLRACLLALVVAVATPHQAAGWGTSGHSIIAEIAQRRLHPDALAAIKDLLGGEVSLASVAGWPDALILLRPETVNWHFVNIPYDATGYVPERDCADTPRGHCVIKAIERMRETLADTATLKVKRAEALKYLVHLIGDVHQPFHVIDRNDMGGNQVAVTFFDRPLSLHALWDFGIIERRTFDWGDYVRYLELCWLPDRDTSALSRGDPVDWAMEAHAAAVKVGYVLPEDLKLGDEYYRRSVTVVDRQLALAGLRLARVLNAMFGQEGFAGAPAVTEAVAADCAVK